MDETTILRILLGELRDKLSHLTEIVSRDARFPDAPQKIKVAIGMRRTGKTYFLYQHILKLLEEGVNRTSILYINFEDDRLLPLDGKKLAKLVDAFYSLYPENHDRKCYLFFDEIQNVEEWATVIRRLHDSKQAEIFLTGSSAKLLSKEIATNLRGRSLSVEIWPYSFEEFLRAKKINIDRSLYDKKTQDILTKLFHDYLSTGGLPEVTNFPIDIRQKTLQDYLDVALYRDIIERHQIKNPSLIKYMILSMVHNTSKPFAINKFYHDLKSQGHQIGKDTLYQYAEHIEDAYLLFLMPIYEKSFRKTQLHPKKLYTIDPGMVRACTFDYSQDLGRLFENVIYLDLRRLDCKISYYLTSEHYEIDFLTQTGQGQKKIFQVAWQTDFPQTLEREQRALNSATKELNCPGELITLDSYLQKGISLN